MKTWIQTFVARLFGITIEDPDRIQREKRYAFIDGQRSVITVNELRGLRAAELQASDGRPFTILLPHSGHAMLDDGNIYKITYARQCPVNAKRALDTSVLVEPGALVLVASKADDEAIRDAALSGGGT